MTIEEQASQIENNEAQIEALWATIRELKGGNNAGTSSIKSATLGQNMPNPSTGMTTIQYELPEGSGFAKLLISDALGRKSERSFFDFRFEWFR